MAGSKLNNQGGPTPDLRLIRFDSHKYGSGKGRGSRGRIGPPISPRSIVSFAITAYGELVSKTKQPPIHRYVPYAPSAERRKYVYDINTFPNFVAEAHVYPACRPHRRWNQKAADEFEQHQITPVTID